MDDVIATDRADGGFVPDGYDSADDFLEDVRKNFTQATDADRENRDAGLDDARFVAGEQWDEAVKAARIRKKLPVLTVNTLPQHIGQVVGDIRINRPAIQVRPAEDGDKDVAEIRQGLIRYIESKSNAQNVYALAGEDQVTCGVGNFRIALEYASDDTFNQDIRVRHIADPFAVVWDPLSTDPTGADARWCFVVDEMDRAAFKEAYPDAADSQLEVPEVDAGWVTRDTVRVTEYWVMKQKMRKIALTLRPPAQQPSIEDITDNEAEAKPFILPGPDGRPRVRTAPRNFACMYLTNGVALLSDRPYELPISRLPIIKVTGREVRIGRRRVRYSLVRWAKDPARLKNLWRSSAAQFVGQAPKSQWVVNTADEEEKKAVERAAKSGEAVIAYTGENAPQRIDPPAAPAALLQQANIADQDIKDATGLHNASLGQQSNETSGKAILARESQGDVATFMYHDNLHYAVREGGRVMNDLIPLVFDTARTIVTLGDDDTTKTLRINDPNGPDGHVDLKVGRYDVILEVGPSYSTKRAEAADSMMKFAQAVPAAAAVTADLIADTQDWPRAGEFAERLRKMLPPALREDDDEPAGGEVDPNQPQGGQQGGEPSPEAQAQQLQLQAAQAAQQAQMRKLELELAEQAAKTDEAKARAAKAEADARRAQIDAEKAELELRKAALPEAPEPQQSLSFDLSPEEQAQVAAAG